jgi:ABC-type sugar transport system ATPase subunit
VAGAGVVIHSPELDELLAVCDRMLVVHGGRVAECVRDRDAVGRAMLGLA